MPKELRGTEWEFVREGVGGVAAHAGSQFRNVRYVFDRRGSHQYHLDTQTIHLRMEIVYVSKIAENSWDLQFEGQPETWRYTYDPMEKTLRVERRTDRGLIQWYLYRKR